MGSGYSRIAISAVMVAAAACSAEDDLVPGSSSSTGDSSGTGTGGGTGGTAGIGGSAGSGAAFSPLQCPDPLPAGWIACETFEAVTPGDIPEIDPTGSGQISRSARTFYCEESHSPPCDGAFLDVGCNPGQCARAYVGPYVDDQSYTEPKWRFDNTVGGSEDAYVRFDLRVDENLGTSHDNREVADFKLIRITDHTDASAASSDHWHPQLNLVPSSDGYRWYTWSGGDCYSEYYFSRATTRAENHLMDNGWHTLELYISIGTHVATSKDDPAADGIVRLWEDGALVLEDTSVPMRCGADEGLEVNSLAFLRHAKSLGAPVGPMEGNLYFDNLLVLTQMPD